MPALLSACATTLRTVHGALMSNDERSCLHPAHAMQVRSSPCSSGSGAGGARHCPTRLRGHVHKTAGGNGCVWRREQSVVLVWRVCRLAVVDSVVVCDLCSLGWRAHAWCGAYRDVTWCAMGFAWCVALCCVGPGCPPDTLTLLGWSVLVPERSRPVLWIDTPRCTLRTIPFDAVVQQLRDLRGTACAASGACPGAGGG
jgi:hypothetical protein